MMIAGKIIVPWRDRHGRFLPLKATVLAASFIPGAVLAFWWANGMLGGRPVTEVIHGTGDWAIRYLLISLAITPAARVPWIGRACCSCGGLSA